MISVSASYASNVSDNITSINSKETGKVSNLDNSAENIKSSPVNSTLNKNTSTTKILAAGDNDRPSKLSQDDIIAASQYVNEYISRHQKLPNYVTISDYKYSIPEFMYLLAKTIEYKYDNKDAQIIPKYNIKSPAKPTGTDIKGKISSEEYYDYATRIAKFISSKTVAPNYVSIESLGNMQYQAIIYSFIKILEKKNLPKSLSLNIKKSDKINKFMPKYTRTANKVSKPVNDKYAGESLEEYLEETKNCQVNEKTIKSLSTTLTSKYTSVYQKAEAIFNYVNCKIDYIFYYNTKNGAKNTISKKGGNCVDKSHLIVALCRAANIPARYIHGSCKFISGNVYGHVWTQILVGNTWTAADPSHSKLNKFGVINNWDTNSYTLKGIYNEIPF